MLNRRRFLPTTVNLANYPLLSPWNLEDNLLLQLSQTIVISKYVLNALLIPTVTVALASHKGADFCSRDHYRTLQMVKMQRIPRAHPKWEHLQYNSYTEGSGNIVEEGWDYFMSQRMPAMTLCFLYMTGSLHPCRQYSSLNKT